jgi:type I restriction enzyme M protein
VSDWSGDLLRNDGRWQYGTPPSGNANYAWIQHFLYHLAPTGTAGFVLAKGALTSKTSGEGDIRKELIEADLVDCIVNLPAKLFLNTQIPASLWFLSRKFPSFGGVVEDRGGKNPSFGGVTSDEGGRRSGQILFIDARNLGHLINRRTRELSEEDIKLIATTYHLWKKGKTAQSDNAKTIEEWQELIAAEPPAEYGKESNLKYEDIPGFSKSETIERVAELDYVLTPGRYVGLPEEEDDFDFEERFSALKVEFEEQLKEEERLNALIKENLKRIKMPE